MNGTERNVLAFAYAKRAVLFRRPSVDRWSLLAPRAIVTGIYEAEKGRVPPNEYRSRLPVLHIETDREPEIYHYIYPAVPPRDWLAACAIAAIHLWHHRFRKDLGIADRLEWRATLQVLEAAESLRSGGSPVANAARIITTVQRRWGAERRRRGLASEGADHAGK